VAVEQALTIGRVAMHALDLVETEIRTATVTLNAAKAQLSRALADLEAARDKIDADKSGE
jgi:hypothetical protein